MAAALGHKSDGMERGMQSNSRPEEVRQEVFKHVRLLMLWQRLLVLWLSGLVLHVPAIASAADMPPSYDRSAGNVPPVYPVESRALGEHGTVVVRALISVDGNATKLQLITSSGYDRLDTAALSAVSGWKFKPATRNGQPVEAWAHIPIVFKLQEYSDDRGIKLQEHPDDRGKLEEYLEDRGKK
jgi:TonB family protein